MTEPNTVNRAFIVPNTGDLPGAWGTAALNPNFSSLDGLLGGVGVISVSGATTVTLSAPSGSITPGAGPTQQENGMLRMLGTSGGNVALTFSVPGFYIIDNQITFSGGACLTCNPSNGTGSVVGIPYFAKTHVAFDGVGLDFVNPPLPGTPIDLHGATSVPAWMQACSRKYALIKDGTTYNVSDYPALGAQLGSSFGGNGVTTFAVPDESSRMRLAWDSASTGRVTSAGSGIQATSMGAAGGDQSLQSHTHVNTLTDPGHVHPPSSGANTYVESSGGGTGLAVNQFGITLIQPGSTGTATTGITINNAAAGSGNSQNMPPTIVSFLALIKT